jgi:hypothetical protein
MLVGIDSYIGIWEGLAIVTMNPNFPGFLREIEKLWVILSTSEAMNLTGAKLKVRRS